MANYNPYYQPYIPYQPTQGQIMQNQMTNQQIQNGGFVSVPNIDVARTYPVAQGNSVTFKDENAPYVYVKTVGFSQLDRPIFEKFRLVKEQDIQEPQKSEPTAEAVEYALKSDIDQIKRMYDDLKSEIDKLAGGAHE